MQRKECVNYLRRKYINSTILEPNQTQIMKCRHREKISWSGIFAGTVAALVIEALLNLLGMGTGLVSFAPDKAVVSALSIGAVIWLILVSVVSLFLAGWIAAKASGKQTQISGIFQGFITWCTASLIVWLLMTTAIGVILGGITSITVGGLKGAGIAAISQQDNLSIFKLPVLASLQERIKPGVSSEKIVNDLKEPLKNYVTADNDQERKEASRLLSVMIAQNTTYSSVEVQQNIAKIEEWVQKIKDNAAETAKKTTQFIGSVALAGFFAFLVGAIAAMFGGLAGSLQNRNESERDI